MASHPNVSEAVEKSRRFRVAGLPISAIAFLVLSAVIALIRSHYHLLWIDEFNVLETVRISNLRWLIHVQLTTPISFDPLGYLLFIHALTVLFGATALVMRVPSMLGYLLMQVCLFYFVRRITTERAAIFALAFPALIGVVNYSVDARPYAPLLGLCALALLSWQTATRESSKRTVALVVLSASLILAVNTQYYGVLLFIPICIGELVRLIERRRVDVPVLASILAGLVGIFIVMPSAKALSPFRTLDAGVSLADYHFITHSYLWLFVGYETLSVHAQHLVGAGVAVLLIALVACFFRFRSRIRLQLPSAETASLLGFAALPIFGFILGVLVFHLVQERYILPAVLGLTAILAILMAPLLQARIIGRIILPAMFLAIAGCGIFRIHATRKARQATFASLALNAGIEHRLQQYPAQPIYVTNPTVFALVGYYSPSDDLRSRITLIHSRSEEMLFQHESYISGVAADLQAAGNANVVTYESVSKPGTEHLFLLYHNSWEWTDQALQASGANVKILGQYCGGDLALVDFPRVDSANR